METTERKIERLAATYLRSKDQLNDIELPTLYEITEYINKEFDNLPCEVEFVDKPMDDFEEVKDILNRYNKLVISKLNNNSSLFSQELNLKFRAIHDSVHVAHNLPFDFEGEYESWKIQCSNLSHKAKQVFFSEIVMQAAFFLFNGYFAERQKIVLIDQF